MAHNPLLGSRISLISKKNIRYDGTLYSINEADATVALENVKSYGTEGRELLDTTGASTFVPPQDVVHAYLLFRGQDIKDLHVHEKPSEGGGGGSSQQQPTEEKADKQEAEKEKKGQAGTGGGGATNNNNSEQQQQPTTVTQNKSSSQQQKRNTGAAPSSMKQRKNMVGTGASLLNKNLRGGKGGTDIPTNEEFDFESNLASFDKVAKDSEEEDNNNNAKEYEQDSTNNNNVYSKDDFFDSISCDALDKQQGIDNRLRGAAERSLNLDTFGAVSLGHGRRGGRGGRGRGGRGRGYGRGRGGGGRGYYNNRDENRGSTSTSGRRGGYGQEATGSGPAPKQNNRWKSNN